jgi:hypothetical protein
MYRTLLASACLLISTHGIGSAQSGGGGGALLKDKVSRNGFTWTFSTFREVGKYVNGDWWVVGPVTITAITPAAVDLTSPTANGWQNGSVIDPNPQDFSGPGVIATSGRQGFREDMWTCISSPLLGWYDHSLNVGATIAQGQSYTLQPGDSLVSSFTQNVDCDEDSGWENMEKVAVLTCVSSPAGTNDFRPSYCPIKGPTFTWSDSMLSRIPRLSAQDTEPVPLAQVKAWFDNLWFSYIPSILDRNVRPNDYMGNYSADWAEKISVGLCTIMRPDLPDPNGISDADRKFLAVRLIQIGIDWFNVYQNRPLAGSDMWNNGAGQCNGYWPITIVAGHILNDDASLLSMPAVGNEGTQYFFVLETPPGSGIWNNGLGCYASPPRSEPRITVGGEPEWGPTHYKTNRQLGGLEYFTPDEDWAAWPTVPYTACSQSQNQLSGSQYRTCCSIAVQWGELLAILAMGKTDHYNSKLRGYVAGVGGPDDDVWPLYADRYEWAEPSAALKSRSHPWQYMMWKRNRASFSPPVWQP